MFSLRKRIEDSVLRAEMLAPTALEFEEAKHVDHEEVIHDSDLWDDLSKSNEILAKLADSAKVVDTLRDLTYKVLASILIYEYIVLVSVSFLTNFVLILIQQNCKFASNLSLKGFNAGSWLLCFRNSSCLVQAEEAKLITELAEMDAINYELFKQAYTASLDVNKFLDKYEMSKLLKEPYDVEGACITIESRCGDAYSKVCTDSFLSIWCWRDLM